MTGSYDPRSGWKARDPRHHDEWEDLADEHSDHNDAAIGWAREAWGNYLWECVRDSPWPVLIRSPEGREVLLEVTVDFDPTFYAREKT